MGLEAATFIDGLVATNPTGTDQKLQGDDHLRLLKSTIKATFPNLTGALTGTQDQLNAFSGLFPFTAGDFITAASASALQKRTAAQVRSDIGADNATNLTSGTVPDARFPATLPAVSGANLTNLNGTNVASGTVADARLSANVPLKNATATISAAWTFTDNVVIGADSKELRFGTGGDDLALYHDGTNSYIDSNTSHLIVRANGTNSLLFQGGDFTTKLQVVSAGVSILALYDHVNNLLRAGTYTPTLTNVANCASLGAFTIRYIRVGNVVHVSGQVTVDPTSASTLTRFRMTLPIASDLASGDQLSGTAVDGDTTNNTSSVYSILGDATNNAAEFRCESITQTNARVCRFNFTYEVI